MPKTKISEFSSTPGNNTDIDGINIAEGCAPSGINDAIRELMSQLKDFQAGTAGDSFNGPVGTTTAAAGAFTTLSASGAVTLSGGTANGVPYLNGSKVLTTGSALTFDGTNLGFGGTGQRITGDFSNATFANRLMFQTSTANSSSAVSVLPSGTSSTSAFQTYNNSDPTNASLGSLIVDSGALSLQSTIRGTGTYLPMTLWTGGSERMRIDSNGNVGIGTSSPSTLLHTSGTVTSNVATGNVAGYVMSVNGTATGFLGSSASGTTLDSRGATFLSFQTNSSERARIDSSGRVTMPFQPAFHAERNTAFNASSGVVVFEGAPTNIGSHYNTSTGRFTAPVAGTYIFFVSFFTNITNAPIDFRIVVNGVAAGGNATTGTTSIARDCHAHLIRTLAVNDYVEIQAAGFGINIPGSIGIFQNFSGRLVS